MAKLNGGLMELEETLYWIDIIERADFVTPDRPAPIKDETDHLIAIFFNLIKRWKPRPPQRPLPAAR